MTNYATSWAHPRTNCQSPTSTEIFSSLLSTTYSQGRHNVKFGAGLTHERGGFINGSSSTGIFNFTGIYSGNSFAEFLLGIPASVTRDYYKTLNGDFGYYMNLYVQDNYRVSERLTLIWDFVWSAIRFTRGSTVARQHLT